MRVPEGGSKDVKSNESEGGVRRLFGRLCGGAFCARDPCVVVAPMVAGACGEDGMSAIRHSAVRD
jgi:hypothetical protein